MPNSTLILNLPEEKAELTAAVFPMDLLAACSEVDNQARGILKNGSEMDRDEVLLFIRELPGCFV